ncbi:MFS domain-containing protein [Fusarium keratoplasticum]|uniref:MFS domain-containing protein n=1 Tax=Fusarium keratoplasticum TaxID=1328300 RepID=A0ACC0QHD1_9HYPO|nr:MFS domain-containing protein [Fusarium keratoplasticum]KAI8652807.1 MFS domain-containing protein [Fusarium keratoplasticum]
MIVGAAILASSYTVAQLIVGRIVTGIGNGMNSSTAPVYKSECSPAAIRGALLTLQGTVTILRVVISYWMDYGTSFTESSLQWRFHLAFQAVFAIFQVIGLPESPRWLVQHEKYEEVRQTIAAIADKPDDDADWLGRRAKRWPFSIKEIFFLGEVQNLRRLLIAISIQLAQQFSGSNMINYYAPVIFQGSIGLSRNTPLIVGGCSQITYLIGSCIPVFWMDRYGRQTLLMACSVGLSFCFVMVSILLSLGSTGSAYGATAFIFLFQLIIGVEWLPVLWFYPTEINTTQMAVFAVVKITPIAFENIGWKTFIIFAVLNACFLSMVYCFYPETKGIELEDIPLLFVKGGVTGGVLSSKGGRTVMPHQHAQEMQLDAKVGGVREEVEDIQA